jgi:site-specific DNA-methyltransferase (adenine-specific)
MKIDVSSIRVVDRKRELGDIVSLAQSIKDLGLLNPITVLPDHTLVAGYHRLQACKSMGWAEIDANIVALDALNAELAEIDENLIRNELHWFDRDKQLARRKEIYEALHPETKQGAKGGWHNNKTEKLKKPIVGFSSAFIQDTSDKTGKGITTVKDSIQRASAFTDEQGEILKRTAIPQTDATKLARLEEPKRAAVINTIATGKARNIKEAVKVVKQEERQEALVTTDVDLTHYNVYHCDISNLSSHVTSNSVDIIITDPPYPQEFLHVYDDLGKFAAHALKPGGSLIVMVGQSYLPSILSTLVQHLDYHWTLSYLTPGGQSAQLWQRKINTFWKPLLWFTKGDYNGDWIGDVCKSNVNNNDKDHHHWGQSESGMSDIVDRFTQPGQLLCDPFVGGGTTGVVAAMNKRYFVGCDIEASCVETTMQRIREVLHEQL